MKFTINLVLLVTLLCSTAMVVSAGQTPVGSVAGQTPVGSATGQTPVGSVCGQTPVGSVSCGQTPVGSVACGQTPVGSVAGQTPVGSLKQQQDCKNTREPTFDDKTMPEIITFVRNFFISIFR